MCACVALPSPHSHGRRGAWAVYLPSLVGLSQGQSHKLDGQFFEEHEEPDGVSVILLSKDENRGEGG